MLKIACRFSCFLCKAARGFQPRSFIPTEFRNGSPMRGKQLSCSWVFRVSECKLCTQVGDLIDMHSYVGPNAPVPTATRAAVLGEFGGLGLRVDGHLWIPEDAFCYEMETNPAALEVLTLIFCSILETKFHARSPRCANTIPAYFSRPPYSSMHPKINQSFYPGNAANSDGSRLTMSRHQYEVCVKAGT